MLKCKEEFHSLKKIIKSKPGSLKTPQQIPKSESKVSRTLMATPEMLDVILCNKDKPKRYENDAVSQVFTSSTQPS